MAALLQTTLCYLERGDCYLMLHRVKKEKDVNRDKWIGIGGKFEPGEDARACVVREAREEIGLELPPEAVLGRLDDYPTRSGYLITPIVAWAPEDAQMRANPA